MLEQHPEAARAVSRWHPERVAAGSGAGRRECVLLSTAGPRRVARAEALRDSEDISCREPGSLTNQLSTLLYVRAL